MEIGSAASGHQDRGDAEAVVEFPHPVNEGDDGLAVPVDDPLHQLVPDHEIGGAGVLVNEENFASRLHGFHHIGGLGSAAAGVLRGEAGGISAVWQVADKHGDIHCGNASAVFSTKFYGGVIGNYILPPIPGDVIVDAKLQRF